MLIGRVLFRSAIQVGQKGTHFVPGISKPDAVRMSEYMVCVHSKALIGGLRHVRCHGRCKGMGTTSCPKGVFLTFHRNNVRETLIGCVEFAG